MKVLEFVLFLMLGVNAVLVSSVARTLSAYAAWVQTKWFDAEVAHVLTGTLILFAGLTHGIHPLLLYSCFVLATGIKEFVIDASRFEGDTTSGDWQDFIAYQIGAICGTMALGHFWLGAVATAASVSTLFVYDLTHPDKAVRR